MSRSQTTIPSTVVPRMTAANPTTPQTCPDCGGQGRYVGLRVTEPCQTCNGKGRLGLYRVDVITKHDNEHDVFRYYLSSQFDIRTLHTPAEYFNQLSDLPDCIVTGWDFDDGNIHTLVAGLNHAQVHVPLILCTALAEKHTQDVPARICAVFRGAMDVWPDSDDFRRALRDACEGRLVAGLQ